MSMTRGGEEGREGEREGGEEVGVWQVLVWELAHALTSLYSGGGGGGGGGRGEGGVRVRMWCVVVCVCECLCVYMGCLFLVLLFLEVVCT